MLKKIIFSILFINFVFCAVAKSAESGGMPQLNPEFWISQIFWLILTFGTLFIVLSKLILPKISSNLETRKSQILENIETAEKQRQESESKIKEFEKIILNSKIQAKSYFNDAKQKVLAEVSAKKESLDKKIDEEIKIAEKEIKDLKKASISKINAIAAETSFELIKQILNIEVNKSSVSAIVDDVSKRNREKQI